MNLTPPKWPQFYLDRVRKVFEPRYGEKLSDEKVIEIANNLYRYAAVCHNAWTNRQKKEERGIRTQKDLSTKGITATKKNLG